MIVNWSAGGVYAFRGKRAGDHGGRNRMGLELGTRGCDVCAAHDADFYSVYHGRHTTRQMPEG